MTSVNGGNPPFFYNRSSHSGSVSPNAAASSAFTTPGNSSIGDQYIQSMSFFSKPAAPPPEPPKQGFMAKVEAKNKRKRADRERKKVEIENLKKRKQQVEESTVLSPEQKARDLKYVKKRLFELLVGK